jgi:hypothetical protein
LCVHDQTDRREILDRVIADIAEQARIRDVSRRDRNQRMTVRRCASGKLTRDVAPGAGTVVDDERLSQRIGKLLRDQPRNGIGSSAGRQPDKYPHRPVRVGRRRSFGPA